VKRARQSLLILAVAAVFCAAWSLALRALPRPALAETNYEANRLRIENWLLGPPAPAVVVGTSLSGRLLPGYFDDTPLAGMANLGLDGACPETGLKLALMRQPTPKLVLLEVQYLSKPPARNDQQLLELATGVGLQVSKYLPLTRADARPSTVLYGWLKERQRDDSSHRGEPVATRPERGSAAPTEMVEDPDWRQRIEPLIRRLEDADSRVMLLRLPAGRRNPSNPEAANEADTIAAELGVPLLDLLRIGRQRGLEITYSDGLHLTPSSARAVSRLLAEQLNTAGPR
jgi:hypothetical protein